MGNGYKPLYAVLRDRDFSHDAWKYIVPARSYPTLSPIERHEK